MACPNTLPVSKAVRSLRAGKEGFFEVEGDASSAASARVPARPRLSLARHDVAAERKQASKDKFVMRPGRGPLPLTEILQSAFSMVVGQCSRDRGHRGVWGCAEGRNRLVAYELTRRNCMVFTAGCGRGGTGPALHRQQGQVPHGDLSGIDRAAVAGQLRRCAAISLANNMYMYSRGGRRLRSMEGIPEVGEGVILHHLLVLLWGAVPGPDGTRWQRPIRAGDPSGVGRLRRGPWAASCRATATTAASGGFTMAMMGRKRETELYRSTFWCP